MQIKNCILFMHALSEKPCDIIKYHTKVSKEMKWVRNCILISPVR